jgi:hypothetical protein
VTGFLAGKLGRRRLVAVVYTGRLPPLNWPPYTRERPLSQNWKFYEWGGGMRGLAANSARARGGNGLPVYTTATSVLTTCGLYFSAAIVALGHGVLVMVELLEGEDTLGARPVPHRRWERFWKRYSQVRPGRPFLFALV